MITDDIFTPSEDIQNKYKEQLAAVLETKGAKTGLIDMGRLPEVYKVLGIKDKQLKANGMTILKALGFEGKNTHHVPLETVKNLISLVYDPEAVFKSLSTSKNPNAFIAVLNAKTDEQKPIIAIISPSQDGQGYTFIPSVYERNNFNLFLARTYEEQKILYIKSKGSEIWGQKQLPPRHTSEPYPINILTKDDVVKRILTKKEQNMSTSLQKINEHINNNSTVQADGSVRVTGLSELNRKLNEDKPFFGDILKFALTNDRLPTDAEIAQMPKQGEYSALGADQNIIDKENRMSDELEPGKPRDPKEEAFLNAVHQRKVIADAIKAGTLSCLPGADGYADTSPASNLVNGTNYHGANLLFLKDHQKQNGFPSAEYVTSAQLDKAKQDNPDLFIRKGEKGVSLYVSEKIEGTADKYEEKQIRLFNIAQTNRPDKLEKWAEQKQKEDRQSYIEWGRKNYGSNWNPPEQKPKEPGPAEIACTSTDPAKYLGEYLAAVSMGSKFKASPEQATEFSQKMTDALYAKLTNKETGEFVLGKSGEPVSDPFSLDKISREANLQCKEITKNIRMEAQKQDQPEIQQEQTQSHGRGM